MAGRSRGTPHDPLARLEMPALPASLPGLEAYEETDVPALVRDGYFKSGRSLKIIEFLVHFFAKAVEQYGAARITLEQAAELRRALGRPRSAQKAVEDWILEARNEEKILSLFTQARDHLERCVHLLRRAILFGRHYRRDRGAPRLGRSVEKLSVLSDAVWSRISRIRNALEHVDEAFIRGKVDTIWLDVAGDGITFAGETVYFAELLAWLREFDSLIYFMFHEFPESYAQENEEFMSYKQEDDGDE